MSLVNLTGNVFKEKTSRGIPNVLSDGFSFVEAIHQGWSCCGREQKGALQTGLDYGIGYLFKDSEGMKFAAHCWMIATRINECIQGYAALFTSSYECELALKGAYSFLKKKAWGTRFKNWISSSGIQYVVNQGKYALETVWQIAKQVCDIVKKWFILVMFHVDMVEAFYWTKDNREQAVNQIASNFLILSKTTALNADFLNEHLIQHKKIVAKLFDYCKVPFSIDELLERVNGAAKIAQVIVEGVEILENEIVKESINFGKLFLFSCLDVIGLSGWLPVSLTPTVIKVPPLPRRIYGQFLSNDWQRKKI